MRIKLAFKPKTAGALIISLVICAVASLAMAGYLLMVEQQNNLSARSQSWNVSMAVVEAGIEEALEHLNANSGNLTADGWTFDGTFYNRRRTLPDGNSYSVSVSVTNASNPIILSEATVKSTLIAQNESRSFYAQIGGTQPSSSTTVTRAVRVGASKGGLFLAAMVAKKTIDMNGNGVATDSFDSSDPRYSTNGQYDPKKTKDKGDVATNEGIVNALDIGNANIYGHAHTGPGGGVALGPNGGIGSHAWQAGNSGIQPGWFVQDSNFTFPDTTAPYNSGLTPSSGSVVTTTQNITSNSVTSATPPATTPWGGIASNVLSTTTVATYPNPVPPGLTTNTVIVSVSSLPNPLPAGLTTNTVAVNNSPTLPSPVPPGAATNSVFITGSTTLPSPIPGGTTTNVLTTWVSKGPYPSPGTYEGSITPHGNGYDYYQITGYTYNYTMLTYNYSTYIYNYPTYTYNIPTYNYTYNNYSTNIVYTTNYYDHILYSGDYYATSLSGKTIVLGTARLVLPNGLSMGSTDGFTIGPNGSISVYAGGSSCTLNGNGVINQPGYAANLIVYCAPSVTSFALNGNAGFTGVLIAPNVDIKMNGGGNNTIDFIGCLMVNSVTMNGHFNFHYDEALGNILGNGRYLITSWDEISSY